MKVTRPELPAYGLGALAIVAIAVLAGTNHAIPAVLQVVAGGAIGGGLGVSFPSAVPTVPDSAPSGPMRAPETGPVVQGTPTNAAPSQRAGP